MAYHKDSKLSLRGKRCRYNMKQLAGNEYTSYKKQPFISVSPKVYVSLHDETTTPLIIIKTTCIPIHHKRHNE